MEDIPHVVRLWRRMWDTHTPLDERFQATPVANNVMTGWIEENLSSDRSAIFVAENGGDPQTGKWTTPKGPTSRPEILGYCLALILENPPVIPWPYYGLISEISAAPEGRGIGGALLDSAHAWLRERSIPYVEVSVSVRNAQARRFWRKKGYGEFLERLRLEL